MCSELHQILRYQASVGSLILFTHRQKFPDLVLSRDPASMERKDAKLRESLGDCRGKTKFCHEPVFATAKW